jgi:O-antigen/teichoic acid export membrane protein
MDRLSLYRVIAALLSSAITVGVLAAGGGVVALLGGSLVAGVVMWRVAQSLAAGGGATVAIPAGAAGAMLRRAVPFGLLMAGFALYYRIDMVMLEWLAAPGELGRYAAAYRFLDAVIALAASLGGPLFPRLSSVAVSAPAEARRLLEAGWRPLLALGLPLTIGTLAIADDIVALLFGPEFAGAGRLLRLLMLGTLPLFWVNVASHALIAADRVWALVGVYALSVLVNVVGNAILVPRWGASGSALATVACEWLNLVLVVRLLRGAFGVRLSAAGLWRYAVAIAAMLMLVWLARPLGVPATVALAAAAYATALWALGYTRSAEHRLVKRLLVEQPRGRRE